MKRSAINPSAYTCTLIIALILSVTSTTLLACDPIPTGNRTPAPTITVAPTATNYPQTHRAKITALFCDDSTGSYPRAYFTAAKQLISNSLVSAVTPNQDGVTLYVAAINIDPVAPTSSIAPLEVPRIDDYPPMPPAIPIPSPGNPLTATETATVVEGVNSAAISNYNAAVAKVNKSVKAALDSVNSQLKQLHNWDPPVDNGTSVFGCLYLIKTRVQITPDVKELFIASDLQDNITTDLTSDFVGTKALAGVSVHVIYFPGSDSDNTQRAQWCAFFHDSGASAVRIDDTQTSNTLSDLFNADRHLSSTC